MKKLRGLVGGVILAVLLVVGVVPFARATGIPVFDGANAVNALQQIVHMIEQVNQLKNQLDVARSQLTAAEDHLQKMSSVRGMAGIIGSVYDNDMDIDYNDILENAGIKSADDFGLNGDIADIYNDQNRAAAQWQGRSDKFMNQAVDRFTELQKLVVKVNAAPDPKDIMDLQARIQSEEVLLQNEMLKLQMMQSQAQAEQALNEQKRLQELLDIEGNPDDYRL